MSASEQRPQSDVESSANHSPSKLKVLESNNSDFKKLNVKVSDKVDLSCCEFLPHITPNYNLLYAPQNVYMFIKFFYGIYERFLKAKDLIYEKLLQDLAEISLSDK